MGGVLGSKHHSLCIYTFSWKSNMYMHYIYTFVLHHTDTWINVCASGGWTAKQSWENPCCAYRLLQEGHQCTMLHHLTFYICCRQFKNTPANFLSQSFLCNWKRAFFLKKKSIHVAKAFLNICNFKAAIFGRNPKVITVGPNLIFFLVYFPNWKMKRNTFCD